MPHLKSDIFFSTIDSKNLSPVYLFYGEEVFFYEKALALIKNRLNINTLNYEVFSIPDSEIKDIIESLRTIPFLSEKKLVVIKNADRLDLTERKLLNEYINNPVPTSCLVIIWNKKVSKEEKEKEIFISVEKNGIIVNFSKLNEYELIRWIQEYVKTFNKQITSEAISYLIDESGANLLDIRNELDKVILFTQAKKDINIEDIEILSGHTKQTQLSALIEAIESKKLDEALKITERLILEGENSIGILASIYRSIRRLLLFKILSEQGNMTTTQIQKMLNLYPFVVEKLRLRIKKYTVKELERNILYITEADKELKSSNKPELMIFEELFIKFSNQQNILDRLETSYIF